MPDTPTPRLGLHRPGPGDPADVPADLRRLTDRIDAVALGYDQGGALPAAGAAGRLFYLTTNRTLYYDFGGGWVPFSWQPGDVRWTATREAPAEGWLAADGTEKYRSEYPALSAALGTQYGPAVGLDRFVLPDLQGRVPVGAGAGSGLTARAAGRGAGVERVTLTSAQSGLPDHYHHMESIDAGGSPPALHNHGGRLFVRGATAGGGAGNDLMNRGDGSWWFAIGVGQVVNGARNASTWHDNMQPFTVLKAWIKT
jgi:microcystin-dependent protein